MKNEKIGGRWELLVIESREINNGSGGEMDIRKCYGVVCYELSLALPASARRAVMGGVECLF